MQEKFFLDSNLCYRILNQFSLHEKLYIYIHEIERNQC